MYSIEELTSKTKQIKRRCLEMCVNAGIGHVTTAFSCAEIMTALYYRIMDIDASCPDWEDRDRFIMSKNHGSVITYPILADLGFIEDDDLRTFMGDGSNIGGHSKICVSGVDFSGGSLGIGLGVACGLAYGARLSGKGYKTYCLVGDGECYEGSIWEAAMFAGSNDLSNLVVILDRNGMACTDFTEHMLRQEPVKAKWEAFNWETIEIDGHNMGEVVSALEFAKQYRGKKPICIIAKTVKGNGIDFMSNNPLMHGAAPRGEQIAAAFEQIDC
ncbi:MAG: transketolase [Clostridiales bacterium]|nr:transketolase [Clostridiales bacterium]